MKPISKKFIVIVALGGVLVLAAAIVVAVLHKNSNPAISIVGTWYSDKPDSVTFGKEGNYSFAEWNGGNPWLSFAGTYSVSGNTVYLIMVVMRRTDVKTAPGEDSWRSCFT